MAFALGATAAGALAGGVAIKKAEHEVNSLFDDSEDRRVREKVDKTHDTLRASDARAAERSAKHREQRETQRDELRRKYGLGAAGAHGKTTADKLEKKHGPLEMEVAGWFSTGFAARIVSILGSHLTVYKQETDPAPQVRLDLHNAMISVDRKDPERRVLRLRTGDGKEHRFRAATAEEAQVWRDAISAATSL
ncbi:uncharacterized protein MONBRDRAFT_33053 [Monosiga brevicollis MX1]|uniref:PH domain-containing protein n=1 Tax=Monosiga brevicollis TaxID=81824 RepID=A9V392_MONBE|nr:uncharacterized protein MONBRDRAFT_33053 [Monosiga brevicollis MX1]EDQ88019.1 predicted protein [Monosiga brevicollis MX1]|eukprot:XP_001747095.1 hypothetical protein [Monosiga brevicollis MX1]